MDKQQIANYIGEKIKYYRNLNNLTQKELSEKIGIGANAISNYEKGFRSPKKDTMFELAEVFNISIDDLFPPIKNTNTFQNGNTSPQAPASPTAPSNERVVYLDQHLDDQRHSAWISHGESLLEEQEAESNKVINISEARETYEARKQVDLSVAGQASAGTGIWQENDYDTMVSFYQDEIPDEDDYDAIAIVVGRSMEPKIKNGDYLFIKLTSSVDTNTIGIFQVNGENYVKKLKNGYLESLNPEYDDIHLTEDDDIRVIGEVVSIYR